MHELSVTQALIDLAMQEGRAAGARRITALTVRVGALTGIVPESVTFYFEMLGKGTLAEGAELRYEKIFPEARCRRCGHTAPLSAQPDEETRFSYAWLEAFAGMVCAQCGAQDFELIGGHDFALVSIEIE
ncbi:MAG: hydrogenase maturation nickel metallochaperone HypA [Anaerolineae bacterium]|nr:hydrogenase maturation nickel metallochaperone HypA [Anaerolineae bacterium]